MTTNTLKRFTSSTVGAALALGVAVAPSQAANLVSRPFEVSVSSGPLAGNSYGGAFSYDSDLLTSTGSAPVNDFAFDFPGFDGNLVPEDLLGGSAKVVDNPGDLLNFAHIPDLEGPTRAFSFGQNLSAFEPPLNFTYGATIVSPLTFSPVGGGQVSYGPATAVPEPSAWLGTVATGILLGGAYLRRNMTAGGRRL